MVMAQDERSAKYDGMPHSAIATGLVDFILPPQEMPKTLMEYIEQCSHHRYFKTTTTTTTTTTAEVTTDAFQKILILLRTRTGHDFSLYKNKTIYRRIERRMNLHQLDDIDAYAKLVAKNGSELDSLFKELLIGVTSFFRDPEAYTALVENVLLDFLKKKSLGDSVRVWVPACSTGEEAYSIAIVVHECMEKIHQSVEIQIFGTDIDNDAIDIARKGLYPASISADIDSTRLKRYFTREQDGQYRISKLVRETVVFAQQNIIKDPPFTRLDMICCRNLLIYFNAELQKKLLPIFHYSLKPGGILFLGTSETIGAQSELFSTIDKKWRIFQRKDIHVPQLHGNIRMTIPSTPGLITKSTNIINESEGSTSMQLIESILRASGTPPCVIIDDNHDIIYIHGKVGKYLQLPEGTASLNLLEMTPHTLRVAISAAIRKASINTQDIEEKGIHVNYDNQTISLDISVKPLQDKIPSRNLLMVIFKETKSEAEEKTTEKEPASEGENKSASELEQELKYTRQTLQSTIEELETSNEELKSTNEELQSTNEELQSTNEELETSREELQSLNEESITVNTELQTRIDELSQSNDDMKNLLDSTDIATLFLDTALCIRRFTPKMTDIIPLTRSDSGRPLSNLASSLSDTDLISYAEKVLEDLASVEREVKSNDGKYYLLRIRPYRTVNNVIDGVVMTFDDISLRVAAELELKQSKEQLSLAFQATNDAVWDWDLESGNVKLDKGYDALYGEVHTSLDDAWKWRMEHIHTDDRDRVTTSIQSAINSNCTQWQERFRYRHEDGSYVNVVDRAYIMRDDKGKAIRLIGAMLDISQFSST